MKAPRFWYRKHSILGYLLSPLGGIFAIGGMFRSVFAHPYKAGIPVICVGNIVAGGSGKTPTALAIAKLLIDEGHKPVFVTRGYGGTEKGPLKVIIAQHTAKQVGDEALLLARGAPTWIGRDRIAAIKMAEQQGTHIILDDGLQNPNIKPDITLLVVDGPAGFGNEQFIPAGPLRERLKHALPRLDAVVMIGEDKHHIAARVNIPVISAKLEPIMPVNLMQDSKYLAFAGIARPEKFYDTCRGLGLNIVGTRDFSDHHIFTMKELRSLWQHAASNNARLITTEKDFVRLNSDFRDLVVALPVKLGLDTAAMMKLLAGH